MPILLDTHALTWADAADKRLGPRTRSLIDGAMRSGDAWLCPVSFWEVQLGVDRKRIQLNVPIRQ